jgi:hypothetical protein
MIPVEDGMSQLCTLDLMGFCFISSVTDIWNCYVSSAWYSCYTSPLLFGTDICNRQISYFTFLSNLLLILTEEIRWCGFHFKHSETIWVAITLSHRFH